MNRFAVLYQNSKDGKKSFYIDEINSQSIFDYLSEDEAHIKKFRYALELILDGRPPRDLYDKENIDSNTEHVYAIKLFKGKRNSRIYCQQLSHFEQKNFLIIAVELLPKKKSQKNTKKEREIIRRVAGYNYTLKNEP